MRWVPLLFVALVLPGCTMFHPCPKGEDCSYVFTGVMATVTFPAPWNATLGMDGARAAGFSDIKVDQTQPEGVSPGFMAMQPGVSVPQFVAGPYPAGGSAVTLYFNRAPGEAETHAQTRADANATWPSLQGEAVRILNAYENATGWRHAGDFVTGPLEGIT